MPRGVTPLLGALLLTALTLVLAVTAGIAFLGHGAPTDVPEPVVLSASADADTGRIVLVHVSGPTLDVREIEVRIAVGGTGLPHQPSVPFYSAPGFASFPSGPFNPVADPRWEVGERAGLELTGANAAPLSSGVTVRVELYRADLPVAAVETTAG